MNNLMISLNTIAYRGQENLVLLFNIILTLF